MGAIGCVAFGIGTTDVFNSWITKDVRVKVPESVKIMIRGKKHPNVTAKDFILKILSLDYVRSGKALAKVMEYAGEAVEALKRRRARHHDQHGSGNRRLHRHCRSR